MPQGSTGTRMTFQSFMAIDRQSGDNTGHQQDRYAGAMPDEVEDRL